MDLETLHPDLAPLVKGSSFTQLFRLLNTVCQVRYATQEQLNAVNFKLATKPKLTTLSDLGYLAVNNGCYSYTAKTIVLLKENNFNTRTYHKNLTGTGSVQAIAEAAVKLDALKLPDFYSLIYPHFTDLIPDFGIVFKRGHEARLVFVEVEAEKPNWQEYLEGKRQKYLYAATDREVYEKWWKRWSELLRLHYCREEEFCFSVVCIGAVKFDWPGWTFGEKIWPL